MAARRYEISLRVLQNISRVSAMKLNTNEIPMNFMSVSVSTVHVCLRNSNSNSKVTLFVQQMVPSAAVGSFTCWNKTSFL